MSKAQTYRRWFTVWPKTHAYAGQTVEVMPVADHENELATLTGERDEAYEDARRSLERMNRVMVARRLLGGGE